MHGLRLCGLTPSGAHRARHRPEVPCGADDASLRYERHRPEQTTLCRLVQKHAASFIAHAEAGTGAELPRFIEDEFDAFLECSILAHGFLRLRCGDCGHDKLLAFSCKRRVFCPSCRHAALPELRWRRAQNHRGHPRAAGDREDPQPPRVGSAAATQGSGARGRARLFCLRCPDRKHIDTGRAANPQPGRRCASPQRGTIGIRVDPENVVTREGHER